MNIGVRHIMIFLLSIVCFISCENFYSDHDEFEEAIAMVESVKVDTVINKTATLTLTCFTPTPCWHYSRIVDKREANQIHLTVYRKSKKYETCIQVVSSFTQKATVSVTTSGSYTIKIYRTPSATMDTIIVF